MGRSKRRAADKSFEKSDQETGHTRAKRSKTEETPKKDSGELIRCTTCTEQILTSAFDAIHKHPHLSVLVCKKCFNYFQSGEITQGPDGMDEQCRWCGDGGRLFGCDFCSNAFCKRCILRNFGRSEIASIEGKEGDEEHKWKCYVCDPSKLGDLITTCENMMQLLEQRKEDSERRKEELKKAREENEKFRAEKEEQRLQRELEKRRKHGRKSGGKSHLLQEIIFPAELCLNPDKLGDLQMKLLEATNNFRTLLDSVGIKLDHLSKQSIVLGEDREEAGDPSEKAVDAEDSELKTKSDTLTEKEILEKKLECTQFLEKELALFVKSLLDILDTTEKAEVPSAPPTPKTAEAKQKKDSETDAKVEQKDDLSEELISAENKTKETTVEKSEGDSVDARSEENAMEVDAHEVKTNVEGDCAENDSQKADEVNKEVINENGLPQKLDAAVPDESRNLPSTLDKSHEERQLKKDAHDKFDVVQTNGTDEGFLGVTAAN